VTSVEHIPGRVLAPAELRGRVVGEHADAGVVRVAFTAPGASLSDLEATAWTTAPRTALTSPRTVRPSVTG